MSASAFVQPIGMMPAPAYAGFWRRFLAAFIDGLLLLILQAILILVGAGAVGAYSASGHHLEDNDWVAGSLAVLINLGVFSVNWLYMALQESSAAQATLGKRALGMRVTDLYGQRIGFGRATGRYFGKIVSSVILCIGFLMIAFTQRKQGLHDMMAETLILKS